MLHYLKLIFLVVLLSGIILGAYEYATADTILNSKLNTDVLVHQTPEDPADPPEDPADPADPPEDPADPADPPEDPGIPEESVELGTTQDSDSSKTRPPPKFLGIGIFRIIPSDEDSKTTFEKYVPYSTATNDYDKKNYGPNKKVGTFFEITRLSTYVEPILIRENDIIQLQILLTDKFRSTKIEGLKIYMDMHEGKHFVNHDEVFIVWNKFGESEIQDSGNHFKSITVNSSLEKDNLWVIIDIIVNKKLHQPDVLIEAWHESKKPRKIEVLDLFEVISIPELKPTDEVVSHTDKIEIPIEHTNPSCIDFDACFLPSDAKIVEGGMVTWINQDETFVHSLASGTPKDGPNNTFNFVLTPGSSASRMFSIPGSYDYYCQIHPWATGTVNVYPELKTQDDKLITPRDPNVAGKVTIPEVTRYPLTVHSVAMGKSLLVQQNDVVYLENRDLEFVISGHVEDPNQKSVTIHILKPDGTKSSFDTVINDNGNYFMPLRLAKTWISGNYEINSFNGKNEIGNISFKVTDDKILKAGGKAGFVGSPLQQMKEGISVSNVYCKPGMILVEKISNGKASCVEESSLEKLIMRGWGKIIG